MLTNLHIRDFAIVPTLELDIHDGFTAITGETGAGKSILVDALGLLLGDRSDAGWVRNGADRAELSAEFSVSNNPAALHWLEESELSTDETCLLRRTINASGRSRAFINGSPVTVAQMQSLGRLLVEVHGQNEHLRLGRTAEQFQLLDRSGDYAADLARVQTAHAEWKQVREQLQALEKDVSIPATELEFLNFQLAELQQHDLSAAAIKALQTEHDRLAAGDSLLAALNASIDLLDTESAGAGAGINPAINTTLSHLQDFTPLDSDINEACTMLQEAVVNCQEASLALRNARDRVDLNPSRFEDVASTLGQLHDLARKHRTRMEELEAIKNALDARIERAASAGQRRSELEAMLESRLAAYRTAAQDLHKKRSTHAADISKRVLELMNDLGMSGGSFELAVSLNPDATPSPRGDDGVQINISANPGAAPGPLNKIASGGELSRISLAIKVATTSGNEAVTQIFDEVDAGIGGDTANAVGRLMKRLSGSGQALCVTHLAQVAVCAGHQLQVRKSADNTSTAVDTRLLTRDGRVDEIARMLSGKISAQSRAHAQELLSAAAEAA